MALEKFFSPSSVAVVGASREPGKVGYEILGALITGGYEGKVFPVNPKAEEVLGLRCFESLDAIGEAPELVIVVVPGKVVPGVISQAAKLKIGSAIVISAGFGETGDAGRELERDIVRIARQGGVRIIGPNCLGLMAPKGKLNASFGGDLPADGGLGYVSQSGALLTAILDMASATSIGFSKLVSIGNKADVDELDILSYLGDDADTTVVAGYLESIGDGNAFVRRAEKISAKKPILLMKSGASEAGAAAASSHTGSLAGSETAYEAAFTRAGIVRCDSIRAQFDYAQAFLSQPLPAGPRVAVVTNAGGPGIMAADAVEAAGMKFAKLSDDTMEKLAACLPPAANVRNPVDVLGDALADKYEQALEITLKDDGVDAAIVLLTPQAMTQAVATAEAMSRVTQAVGSKPVLAAFMGAGKVAEGVEALRQGGIPQYGSPEAAIDALRAMHDYARWRRRPKRVVKLFPLNRHRVERIVDRHLRRDMREIGEQESKEILEACGFVTPKGSVATTAEQAANAADQLGYPVVLKIWSPDIIHKSDVGGVRVGIESRQEVIDSFDLMMYRIPKKMPDADILGVLVQEMCRSGQEVSLGMTRDPHFGPLMMFGMGGIFVEVLKDVSFYLAPLTAEEAKTMLVNTRTYKLLQGARSREGVDVDAIAEGLQRLSQLVTEFPQIVEMDINPYVVGPQGTTPIAVDARISVEKL